MCNKVNIGQEAATISEFWSQRTVAEANGTLFKLARGMGSTNWHKHDDEDELFIVHQGQLTIQLRDRDILMEEGDLFVVPRGVEHCPKAEEEVVLLVGGVTVTSHAAGGKPAWSERGQRNEGHLTA